MVENSPEEQTSRRSENAWASVSRLKVTDVPAGAININVDGRQVVSPLQGFGQLWQKTYKVRLPGIPHTPEEVMRIWKENFPAFQPAENHFFPSMAGIKPGEVVFIDGRVPAVPGTPSILPVASGVMVLYVDETSFTVMTPEGFPESGWNTFSTSEENGCTVAQVQSMARATDPIYEFAFRFLGSSGQQESVWMHVLTKLAAHFGIQGQVSMSKTCVDPKIQWRMAKNIVHNAAVRTVFYFVGTPVRWIRGGLRRKDS